MHRAGCCSAPVAGGNERAPCRIRPIRTGSSACICVHPRLFSAFPGETEGHYSEQWAKVRPPTTSIESDADEGKGRSESGHGRRWLSRRRIWHVPQKPCPTCLSFHNRPRHNGRLGGLAMRGLAVLLAGMMTIGFFPEAVAQQSGFALNIVVVEGDGAINNIHQRTVREPVVQVEDENHRPVAGAVVVFSTPTRGAGAAFADGHHTLTVITDAEGRAVAHGFR